MSAADCFAHPRPAPNFGQWGGGGRPIRPYTPFLMSFLDPRYRLAMSNPGFAAVQLALNSTSG